ncbi:hypothetical protein [Paraburkholderia sp.]|uniref:hypothetical protein n=1 Tax=Paraburkholderia sp. TaxID=1926495 RepID=UPI0025D01A8D|nr:hypothetical protein [Paraburkholderia sp.]
MNVQREGDKQLCAARFDSRRLHIEIRFNAPHQDKRLVRLSRRLRMTFKMIAVQLRKYEVARKPWGDHNDRT